MYIIKVDRASVRKNPEYGEWPKPIEVSKSMSFELPYHELPKHPQFKVGKNCFVVASQSNGMITLEANGSELPILFADSERKIWGGVNVTVSPDTIEPFGGPDEREYLYKHDKEGSLPEKVTCTSCDSIFKSEYIGDHPDDETGCGCPICGELLVEYEEFNAEEMAPKD